MKNLYVVIVLLFSFIQSYAQNGPGGVGTIGTNDISLWLTPESVIIDASNNVTSWSDLSGYGNDATPPATAPTSIGDIVYFKKANSQYLTIDDDPSLNPTNGISMFVVGSYTATTSNWSPFIIKTNNLYEVKEGYGIAKNSDTSTDDIRAFFGKWDIGFLDNSLASGNRGIIESIYSYNSVASESTLDLKIGEDNTTPIIYNTPTNSSDNKLYIGAGPDGNSGNGTGAQSFLDGDISEVILLNKSVNDVERIIIANYLSGKYGLTLNNNNHWDYNATYVKDIIGVGASASSNHLKSNNDVLSLELSTGTTGFLFAGSNEKDILGDSNCGGVPDMSTYKSSMEWKMNFDNLNGNLTVVVDFSSTNFAPAIGVDGLNDDNDIKLLWSHTPGDYTVAGNSGQYLGTADVGNKKWTFVIDNFTNHTDEVYISIGVGRGVEFDGSSLKYIDDNSDADISTADGWENLVVSSGDLVVANDKALYYGRVDVSPGASLKIGNNSLLKYVCGIKNEGTVDVEDGASIVPGLRIRNTCSGTFNVKRNSPAYPADYLYSYWSSPVYQPTLSSVFSDVTPDDYYSFDGATHQWQPEDGASKMLVGKGYAITGADGISGAVQERIFSGSLTTIDVDVPVFMGTGDIDGDSYSDFNLVGNPYAAALDLNEVFADNLVVWDGIAYLYNHQHVLPGYTNDPNDYITTTATGSTPNGTDYAVGTAQGFMIKAKTGDDFKFNTDQEFKTPGNNIQFYKKSPIERIWLVMGNDNYSTSTLLGFTDKATDARDDKYDGVNISGSSDLQFYSLIDDVRFAVQATDGEIQSKSINLGYLAGVDGMYTISILQNELNNDTEVYLEDKVLGITNWNLKKANYEFDIENTSKERINDRFVVSFTESTLSTPKDINASDVNIFINDNVLSISLKNNEQVSVVEMYSTSGKLIESWKGNSSNKYLINSSVSNGVYIVRTYAEGGVFVKKVKI